MPANARKQQGRAECSNRRSVFARVVGLKGPEGDEETEKEANGTVALAGDRGRAWRSEQSSRSSRSAKMQRAKRLERRIGNEGKIEKSDDDDAVATTNRTTEYELLASRNVKNPEKLA
ncbi:hypothetical protein E4U11_003578 [Claviceps purpurea]|nr:hypothetical protein E4U11_003578 [Claviceps purpurea]